MAAERRAFCHDGSDGLDYSGACWALGDGRHHATIGGDMADLGMCGCISKYVARCEREDIVVPISSRINSYRKARFRSAQTPFDAKSVRYRRGMSLIRPCLSPAMQRREHMQKIKSWEPNGVPHAQRGIQRRDGV
jgi:hypothetical protein